MLRASLFAAAFAALAAAAAAFPPGTGAVAGRPLVALDTRFGRVVVRLRPDNAPRAVAAVRAAAAAGSAGRFYRAERRPDAGAPGPPYALLQGSLGDEEALGAPPPREGLLELPLAAGAVALIPGTWEFFIALSDHLEWSDSHTVVGEVHSLSAIDMIAMQPYEEVTHPEHGTVMRMMRREAPFTLAPAAREDLF